MKFKTIVLSLLFFLLLSAQSFGQFSLSYYYANNRSKIGVGYNLSQKFWFDFRMYPRTSELDEKIELAAFYNIIGNDEYMIYGGIGGSPSIDATLFLPIGCRINSSKFLNNTWISVELEPTLDINYERLILTSSIGIRYYFNRKEKK